MSRFFPSAAIVMDARKSLAADPNYPWEAAFVAARPTSPRAHDLDAVAVEFVALADELQLRTGRAPFWVPVVPFTENGVSVGYRVFAIYPGSAKIVHAGQHPRAGDLLSDDDRIANPYLAAFLIPELNSILVRSNVAVADRDAG